MKRTLCLWPTFCKPTGSEYVSVHRGAESAHPEGLPVRDQDGESDEEPKDKVQTD